MPQVNSTSIYKTAWPAMLVLGTVHSSDWADVDVRTAPQVRWQNESSGQRSEVYVIHVSDEAPEGLMLDASLQALFTSIPVVVPNMREDTEEEAKRRIVRFLQVHPGLDAFDIAMQLGYDVIFTQELCERMAQEGSLVIRPITDGAD